MPHRAVATWTAFARALLDTLPAPERDADVPGQLGVLALRLERHLEGLFQTVADPLREDDVDEILRRRPALRSLAFHLLRDLLHLVALHTEPTDQPLPAWGRLLSELERRMLDRISREPGSTRSWKELGLAGNLLAARSTFDLIAPHLPVAWSFPLTAVLLEHCADLTNDLAFALAAVDSAAASLPQPPAVTTVRFRSDDLVPTSAGAPPAES